MINIEIKDNQIEAKGHASTLICNSVSVLMWSLAISLENAKAKDLVVVEDDGYQLVKYEPEDITKMIFNGVAESLALIGAQFPKEVKIRKKNKIL